MGPAPFLVAGWLLLVGCWGVARSRHLVHLVGCLFLVHSASLLVLLGVGYRAGGAAPVAGQGGGPMVDPVVQALTLTDIVVGAVQSALLLAIAIQAQRRFGTLDPDRIRALRG